MQRGWDLACAVNDLSLQAFKCREELRLIGAEGLAKTNRVYGLIGTGQCHSEQPAVPSGFVGHAPGLIEVGQVDQDFACVDVVWPTGGDDSRVVFEQE